MYITSGRARIELAAQERYKALQKSGAAEARVMNGVDGCPSSRPVCLLLSIVRRSAKWTHDRLPSPDPLLRRFCEAELSKVELVRNLQ